MSIHGLKVRWIMDKDERAGLKDLTPIDTIRTNSEILRKMKQFHDST
jgi:hypothetical protein